jgi:hypothetical protein
MKPKGTLPCLEVTGTGSHVLRRLKVVHTLSLYFLGSILILFTQLRQDLSSDIFLSVYPTGISRLSRACYMPRTQHPLRQMGHKWSSRILSRNHSTCFTHAIARISNCTDQLLLLLNISLSWSTYYLTVDSVYVNFVVYKFELWRKRRVSLGQLSDNV